MICFLGRKVEGETVMSVSRVGAVNVEIRSLNWPMILVAGILWTNSVLLVFECMQLNYSGTNYIILHDKRLQVP